MSRTRTSAVHGGSAEAEIETICVLCVGAIDRTAAGCCQIYAHSLVSVDRLPSRARAGAQRARIAVFWAQKGQPCRRRPAQRADKMFDKATR